MERNLSGETENQGNVSDRGPKRAGTEQARQTRYCIMSTKELLVKAIDELPEPVLAEVLDFVLFLKARVVPERPDAALLSESTLSGDWLKP